MDTEEVVDLILEAFHTTVSDDDYVNEQSVRASIWDLVEKYGDAIGAAQADELAEKELEEMRDELDDVKEDRDDLQFQVDRLQKRLEEAEVQLA